MKPDSFHQLYVDRGLQVADPTAQISLVAVAPEGARAVRAINSYDFRPGKVRCAICPMRTPHHKGFTVQLLDGSLCLCGICCGEKVFGKGAWDSVVRDFDRRRSQVRYEALIAPLTKVLDATAEHLPALNARTREIEAVLGSLKENLPRLANALKFAGEKNGGRLLRTKTVVDYAAINIAANDSKYDHMPVPRRQQLEDMGRLGGKEVFVESIGQAFGGFKGMMQRARTLVSAQPKTHKEYAAVFQRAEESKQYLRQTLRLFAAFDEFVRIDNIDSVINWASFHRDLACTYRRRGTNSISGAPIDYWRSADQGRVEIPFGTESPNAASLPLLTWSQSAYFIEEESDQAA